MVFALFTISRPPKVCWGLLVWFLISFNVFGVGGSLGSNVLHPSRKKMPLIYVYTISKNFCSKGLPFYIKETLDHVIFTQPDCDVILASNYKSCSKIDEMVNSITGIIKIDVEDYISNRTLSFQNLSTNVFAEDGGAELWLTSAFRFFFLEDIMNHYNYTELLHLEADNLLYGRVSTLLPTLRANYTNLATTPMHHQLVFLTASAFWIGNIGTLQHFNNYLLGIVGMKEEWKAYIKWIRPYACCMYGGIDQDEKGMGVKIFAVNEMSMLAHYHELYPQQLQLLPIVPEHEFIKTRHVCPINDYKPSGKFIKSPTGQGIWDSGSWGQYLGGTARKGGRDKHFRDATHIIGQAIGTNNCRPEMLCANSSWFWPQVVDRIENASTKCLTAPFVRCDEGRRGDDQWTPLWNIHVHSKHTTHFKSVPCECPK